MADINPTCRFLLEMIVTLQEKHHLNQTAIPILNEYIMKILSSFSTELEKEIERTQGPEGKASVRIAAIKILANHEIMQVGSEYQVIQHLQKYCGFVAPREVLVGERFEEISTPGQEDFVQKPVNALIVPFEDSLAQIFKNREIRTLLETPNEGNLDGKFRNARDGLAFRGDDFFKNHPNSLIIQLYFDDVEVVNALGSRTSVHKITNFYFSLLNIPEYMRSNLKAIGLIACVNSNIIKEFGYSKILQNFFDCLSQLQSEEGLKLQLGDETLRVYGSLFCLCGDGLALNHIGGFKGIGGAERPCRNCSLNRTEMKICYLEKCLRNFETHSAQIQQLSDPNLSAKDRNELSKRFGVIGPSDLAVIQDFDITKRLLQDKMHNLLQGVADVCLRQLIIFLIAKGNSELTLDILNDKLKCFPYPEELIKNKPSIISNNHLSAGLRQKAAQMMCLLCVLPIILAPFQNDLNREHLLNLGLLVQITHRLLAYEVNAISISTLKFMILVHHTRFCKLYPEAPFTPKFHFLTHAPSTIEDFGPCRVSWCFRYEGQNAWFSQAAGDTNNFINIAKTLTQRFQVKRCLDFGFGDPDKIVLGEKSFSPVITSRINILNYPMGNKIANSLGVDENSMVDAASLLYIQNFALKQNTVLVYKDNQEDFPIFCRVTAIFVADGKAVLLVNLLNTLRFDYLRSAFEVEKSNIFACKKTDAFPSLQPFPLVNTSFGEFILPLYYDVNVFEG